jgi:hypothetical protein
MLIPILWIEAGKGVKPLLSASIRNHAGLVTWLVKAGAGPQAGADPQAFGTTQSGNTSWTAADLSEGAGASYYQSAYLEVKRYCSNAGGGGT